MELTSSTYPESTGGSRSSGTGSISGLSVKNTQTLNVSAGSAAASLSRSPGSIFSGSAAAHAPAARRATMTRGIETPARKGFMGV